MSAKKSFDMVDPIVEQLKKGEVSYTSLPRKFKKEYRIVLNSNFDDVVQSAPKGYWKIQDFIKAVLNNLENESKIEFNREHYEKFVKNVKKYNNPSSKIMKLVVYNFSNHYYCDVLFELL